MTGDADLDIPETGAVFIFGESGFADNGPGKFWFRNDRPARLSCGREHSAVTTDSGRIFVFGANSVGQLGLRENPAVSTPASIKAFKSAKVKSVACGNDHTIVCTSKNSIYCAGGNQEGQLGLGHAAVSDSFLVLRPLCARARIRMLAAGCCTSGALTEDGRLFMWGDNSVGQIGLGNELFATEPREVHIGKAVKWISCGNQHSAFVTEAGELYTFGEHANGRLGLEEERLIHHKVPQQVRGLSGHVTQVCCGGQHTVVLTGEDVYTFGSGQYGQLGHGTFLFEVQMPKPLEFFHNCSIKQIACGENHSAVVTNSGLLYTFGDGRHGKLGLMDDNFVNQFSPALCRRFLKYSVLSVSCGGHHTLVQAVVRQPASQDVQLTADEELSISNSDDVTMNDSLIALTPVFPLSALAARLRHREKKLSEEMFGKISPSLPRLRSDFLNSSCQVSRNIQTLKQKSKDTVEPSPTSTPKSKKSPRLSPRSQPVSPLSRALSSRPSSTRSLSSNTSRSKASGSVHLKSKPTASPSPLLSPKSISKSQHRSRGSVTSRETNTGRSLRDRVSSSLSPKEPCSPTGPPVHVFKESGSEPENSVSLQRGGDTSVSEDGEKTAADSISSTGTGRDGPSERAGKRREASPEQSDLKEKRDRHFQESLTTKLLSTSNSTRKEVYKGRTEKNQLLLSTRGNKAQETSKKTRSTKRKPLSRSSKVQRGAAEEKENTESKVKRKNLRSSKGFSSASKRASVTSELSHANTNETYGSVFADDLSQDNSVALTDGKVVEDITKQESGKVERTPKKTKPKVKTKKFTPLTHKREKQEAKANAKANDDDMKGAGSKSKESKHLDNEAKADAKIKEQVLSISDDVKESELNLKAKSKEGVRAGTASKDGRKVKKRKTKSTSQLSLHDKETANKDTPASFPSAGPPVESPRAEVHTTENQELKEGEPFWGESCKDAASLLPVAGVAAAAFGLLTTAATTVTNVEAFHLDSDGESSSTRTKSQLRTQRLKKQDAAPSLSSSLSHWSSTEVDDGTRRGDAASEEKLEHVSSEQERERSEESEQVTRSEEIPSRQEDTTTKDSGKGAKEESSGEVEEEGEEKGRHLSEDGRSGREVDEKESEAMASSHSDDEESGSKKSDEQEEDSSVRAGEESEDEEHSEGVNEEEEEEESSVKAGGESEEEEPAEEVNKEGGEEESSMKAGEESEEEEPEKVSEEEEEDGESEEQAEKSSDLSESPGTQSVQSQEEEEGEEERDTTDSAKSEEGEEGEEEEEEEGEDESEDKTDDTSESEADKMESAEDEDEEESAGGEDDKVEEEQESENEERDEISDLENEEEETSLTAEDEESVEEESDETGEGEGETTGEEEEEGKELSEEEEEQEGETAGEEEEEEGETTGEEEEEEGEAIGEEEEEEGETAAEEKEEDGETTGEEEEEEGETPEDEADSEEGGAEDEDVSEEEEGEKSDEEGGEEEEEESEKEQSESEVTDEESNDEENEVTNKDSSEDEAESEEEEGEDKEEEESEQEAEEGVAVIDEEKEEEENEQPNDDEEEAEEEEVEEEEEEEEKSEEPNDDEEEAEEEEVEEEDDEDEDEEEEEKLVRTKEVKATKSMKDDSQKQTQAVKTERKDKQGGAPIPAPRTKKSAVKKQQQEDPQQFWDNVLPQYLDIQ